MSAASPSSLSTAHQPLFTRSVSGSVNGALHACPQRLGDPVGAVSAPSVLTPILILTVPLSPGPVINRGQNNHHPSLYFSSAYKMLPPQPLCFENDPFSWGYGGRPNIPTRSLAISFLFTLLRILLLFFALVKNSTLFFSSNSALFAKKRGVGEGVLQVVR